MTKRRRLSTLVGRLLGRQGKSGVERQTVVGTNTFGVSGPEYYWPRRHDTFPKKHRSFGRGGSQKDQPEMLVTTPGRYKVDPGRAIMTGPYINPDRPRDTGALERGQERRLLEPPKQE